MTHFDLPFDKEFEMDQDILGIGATYWDKSLGTNPPSDEVRAITKLEKSVVRAFEHHDRDLRAEVEKVNRQILYLVGVVALGLAAILVWPRNR